MSYILETLYLLQGVTAGLIGTLIFLAVVFATFIAWIYFKSRGKIGAFFIALAVFVVLILLTLPSIGALFHSTCSLHHSFCEDDE